jgi:omega-hydroxy-beta-dihydromenaquinone-9 sulfotransferase
MTTAVKHGWSVQYQFLAGITAEEWWTMLRTNRHAVDPRYWHRAAFISMMSVINSLYRRREERAYGVAIERTLIDKPPLFILGHWRSGTTLLHNLLAQDAQFASPTVYQASFPHTFLSTERTFPRLAASYVPPTRVIDNMAMRFDLPQEDEFALCVAGGLSSFLGMVFPRHSAHYDRYLTLRDVPADEVARWKQTLLWFLKKLTLRYNRALLLKSPPHTARVRLLLELFPYARFVHICRNPYPVYQSTQRMYDTLVWHTYLQRPDPDSVGEGIIRRYATMYDAYFEERTLIPAGQLYELRYEDLAREPVAAVQELYAALGLGGWQRAEPRLRAYVAGLQGYESNKHAPLPDPMRQRLAREWGRSFERWGYPV